MARAPQWPPSANQNRSSLDKNVVLMVLKVHAVVLTVWPVYLLRQYSGQYTYCDRVPTHTQSVQPSFEFLLILLNTQLTKFEIWRMI